MSSVDANFPYLKGNVEALVQNKSNA